MDLKAADSLSLYWLFGFCFVLLVALWSFEAIKPAVPLVYFKKHWGLEGFVILPSHLPPPPPLFFVIFGFFSLVDGVGGHKYKPRPSSPTCLMRSTIECLETTTYGLSIVGKPYFYVLVFKKLDV